MAVGASGGKYGITQRKFGWIEGITLNKWIQINLLLSQVLSLLVNGSAVDAPFTMRLRSLVALAAGQEDVV